MKTVKYENVFKKTFTDNVRPCSIKVFALMKMLGLFLITLTLDHKVCNAYVILNDLTLEKELQKKWCVLEKNK